MADVHTSSAGSIGQLLQNWRRARHLSQLALATEAGVSARHLSFLETGRAAPSRDMVLRLAATLDVPLRERNGLLLAAGFAPIFGEAPLDAPELVAVRRALEAILKQHEPFPAVLMNRHWDVLAANRAAERFFGLLLGPAIGPANVVRLMFDPRGLRPYVSNWESSAEALLNRIHREALGRSDDAVAQQLVAEVLAYPDVPKRWHGPDLSKPLVPVIPVTFEKDDTTFSFFSTVTTLGTPLDVTVQELRIECFFPADAETDALARRLLVS